MPQLMDLGADLALFDREGQIIALVEVKNKPRTSQRWAADLRRNILAHGTVGRGYFFLLATPDRLYLWPRSAASDGLPSTVLDARPLFDPYSRRAGLDPEKVSGQAFELVVADWLRDVASPIRRMALPADHEGALREAGFLDASQGSRVEFAAAA